MNIASIESQPVAPGVEALVFKERRTALQAVLEGRLTSADPARAFRGRFEDEVVARPRRFGVRGRNRRVQEVEGVLVFGREQDLVEFLATGFVPCDADRALAPLVRGPARARREHAAGLLRERQRNPRVPVRLHRGTRLDFVLRQDELEELPVVNRSSERRWYERSHDGLLVASERSVPYAGRRIPRRALAWVGAMPEPPSVTWYDGAAFGVADNPRAMPEALYRELDERGRVLAGETRQPLPPVPMEALCLLRVPARKEIPSPARPGAPPPGVFDRPLYLVDTREPVPLPPGLPVVDDPAAAFAVAARAPDGIYVPGDLPTAQGAIGDSPRWCLASRVT